MQLRSLAAVVSIALTLGVQAAPNTFDRAVGLKDAFKRSYSHGVDMSQVYKRATNLVARKRELNHHRRIGKRCTKPKTTSSTPVPVTVEDPVTVEAIPTPQQPQATPSSSEPAPSPTPTPEPTNDNSNNNNNGSGSNDNNNNNNGNNNNAGNTAPDDLAQQWLDRHNAARAAHGAPALTWSNDLANAALSWASGCKFKHSGGTLGRFGENLAAQTGSMSPAQAVQMWMDEAPDYNPTKPDPSHFTQVVWKGSTQLGCAIFACPADTIFPGSTGTADYGVCEYSPPGNVIGQFAANVQK